MWKELNFESSRSVHQNLDQLEPGDHVTFDRGFYKHHAIVIARVNYTGYMYYYMIEFSGPFRAIWAKHLSEVKLTCKDLDEYRNVLCKINYTKCFSSQMSLAKAYSLTLPGRHPVYSISHSNCEHVATWCKTGKWKSVQAQTKVRKLKRVLKKYVGWRIVLMTFVRFVLSMGLVPLENRGVALAGLNHSEVDEAMLILIVCLEFGVCLWNIGAYVCKLCNGKKREKNSVSEVYASDVRSDHYYMCSKCNCGCSRCNCGCKCRALVFCQITKEFVKFFLTLGCCYACVYVAYVIGEHRDVTRWGKCEPDQECNVDAWVTFSLGVSYTSGIILSIIIYSSLAHCLNKRLSNVLYDCCYCIDKSTDV